MGAQLDFCFYLKGCRHSKLKRIRFFFLQFSFARHTIVNPPKIEFKLIFFSGRKLSSTKAFVRIMKAEKTNYFCKVLAFALRIELTNF